MNLEQHYNTLPLEYREELLEELLNMNQRELFSNTKPELRPFVVSIKKDLKNGSIDTLVFIIDKLGLFSG